MLKNTPGDDSFVKDWRPGQDLPFRESDMFMLNNNRNSKVDIILNILITLIIIAILLVR
jgi:hypothetical protein